MALVRPTRPPTRPNLWIVATSGETWNQNDTTTPYELTVFDDEELTQRHDLRGEDIWIVMSNDYTGDNKWDAEVQSVIVNGRRGIINARIPSSVANRIGDFKTECYIFDGINRRWAHHIDFNVI